MEAPFGHKNRVLAAAGLSPSGNFHMARVSALNVSVGIIAAVMVCVAAYQANDVFAPLALALFIIALVWPLQSWLQARMPACWRSPSP
jgi:predicted PurR-regulated permease PerM